jgi:hypothetical protein
MSATSARVNGPETADTAPPAAAVVGENATSEVTGGEGEAVKAGIAEDPAGAQPESKPVEVAQPVGGLPLQEEDAAERHKGLTIARIRLSKAPAAVKERFAELAEAANNAATVEACLKAVEESLPEFLREKGEEVAREKHPAGEVFFRGNAEEITEEQAEEVARTQLARSGLLRGQRVRVAD